MVQPKCLFTKQDLSILQATCPLSALNPKLASQGTLVLHPLTSCSTSQAKSHTHNYDNHTHHTQSMTTSASTHQPHIISVLIPLQDQHNILQHNHSINTSAITNWSPIS